jgi:hypothetical protein
VDSFEIRPDALPEDEKETQATETTTPNQTPSTPVGGQDDYLSTPGQSDNKVQNGGKDKYNTDPVPEGKPQPVEPEDTEVNTAKEYTCSFAIECSTILNNLDMLNPEKLENAKADLSILHPLPRVNEIAVSVDKDPRAAYWRQVKNGKFIRMALILKLLGIKV